MSSLDYHNGKAVVAASPNSLTFSDGTQLTDLLSVVPNEIIGTTLLKVEDAAGVSYLSFGHSYADGRAPTIVAVLEATGGDLEAEDA